MCQSTASNPALNVNCGGQYYQVGTCSGFQDASPLVNVFCWHNVGSSGAKTACFNPYEACFNPFPGHSPGTDGSIYSAYTGSYGAALEMALNAATNNGFKKGNDVFSEAIYNVVASGVYYPVQPGFSGCTGSSCKPLNIQATCSKTMELPQAVGVEITVTRADWGENCDVCQQNNVLSPVKAICDEKQWCRFTLSEEWCSMQHYTTAGDGKLVDYSLPESTSPKMSSPDGQGTSPWCESMFISGVSTTGPQLCPNSQTEACAPNTATTNCGLYWPYTDTSNVCGAAGTDYCTFGGCTTGNARAKDPGCSSTPPEFHVSYSCGHSSPTVYELSIAAPFDAATEIVINCCPNCTDFSVENYPDSSVVGPARRLLSDSAVVSGHTGRVKEPAYYATHAKRRVRRHQERHPKLELKYGASTIDSLSMPSSAQAAQARSDADGSLQEQAQVGRRLLGRHDQRRRAPPPEMGCKPYDGSGWIPTYDASLSYEMAKAVIWKQVEGVNVMELRMLEDAMNITNQYVGAMSRMQKITATNGTQFTFGTLTAKTRQPCDGHNVVDDPCEVSAVTVQVPRQAAVSSNTLPEYDSKYHTALTQRYTSSIHEILFNSSQPTDSSTKGQPQGQLKCPVLTITDGRTFQGGTLERPGTLGTVRCLASDPCYQAYP